MPKRKLNNPFYVSSPQSRIQCEHIIKKNILRRDTYLLLLLAIVHVSDPSFTLLS
jgi:hypothetical protein